MNTTDDLAAQLLDIVGDIYDASIAPAQWSGICERIAKLVSGDQTAIALHDTVSNHVTVSAGWNIEHGLEAAMHNNFSINPMVPAVWHVDVGEPFTTYGYLGEENFKNTKFYKQVAQPFRIGDSALTVLSKSVRKFGALSVQRRDHQPAFTQSELSILRLLAPHLRRAILIADLVDALSFEKDLIATAMDHLAAGIVLTDGASQIIYANEAAGRLIEAGAITRQANGTLGTSDPATARELALAIREAASGTTLATPPSRTAIPIRGANNRDLVAWVLPLDKGLRRQLSDKTNAAVAVFVRDIGDTSPFPAELFVRRYGITPAESRVMSLLVQGMTIQEAAGTLGISLPTAKTHLAHLFSKTGTSRQADLIRLAMSALSPAAP